jgi:glycosyltransferase involved in cell wall biosynthesis
MAPDPPSDCDSIAPGFALCGRTALPLSRPGPGSRINLLMNILFFSEQSPYQKTRVGGAENSMRLMAEGLAARGHRVTFASLRPDAIPAPKRFERNGVAVLLCPSPRRSVLQRALRKAGMASRAPAQALARAGWARVGRILFKGKLPDLVYAFYEMEFLEAALTARAAHPGMVIVMRMAGLGWYETLARDPSGRTQAGMARVFGAVDAINYLSGPSRDLIEARAREAGVDLAGPAQFVADIGVDVSRVPWLWQGSGGTRGLDIVVATRFSPTQKRQDILVEALGLLKDRLPVTATLIGSGATRDAIARRCAELGLSDSVEFVPFLDQAALWERLRRADLLCHPCDHEGVSKIILEAMMLGLPVLASDVAPLPDYVIEGETGFRAANTASAWADRLVEIARARDTLPALSERARRFVEARFDTARNLAEYERQFEALVRRRQG